MKEKHGESIILMKRYGRRINKRNKPERDEKKIRKKRRTENDEKRNWIEIEHLLVLFKFPHLIVKSRRTVRLKN